MELREVNSKNVRELPNLELLSLHRRVHQLWALERKAWYKELHELLANEIMRRGFSHSSGLH